MLVLKKESLYDWCIRNKSLLIDEWDSSKNKLNIEDVTYGSAKKVWWLCHRGHSWEASIVNRVHGTGCPYCSGRLLIKGRNDFVSKQKGLVKEWDFKKNKDIDIENLHENSRIKVWWVCEKGHSWDALVTDRVRGAGCPFCNGTRVIRGLNDLKSVNPVVASEWDYVKNGKNVPWDFTHKSGKLVWWKCKKGHSWQAKICTRSEGTGCPYCSGNKVAEGYNDLYSKHPELIREWDYTKNKISPKEVAQCSGKSAWWVCSHGHSWCAKISSRVHGSGCPECNKVAKTSFGEKALYFYIHRVFKDSIENYKNRDKLGSMELDVYIPSINTGVEYDGIRHDIKRDLKKNRVCERANIHLIRLRDCLLEELNSTSTDIKLKDRGEKALAEGINRVIKELTGEESSVSELMIDKDRVDILSLVKHAFTNRSIGAEMPSVLDIWDYDKNKEISPYSLSKCSTQKVWFKCEKGHNWMARICDIYSYKTGCPYCKSRKVLKGYNDIGTLVPELANELVRGEQDISIDRYNIGINSGKRVLWRCNNCGNEWNTVLRDRVRAYKRGAGRCPKCGSRP